jgi:hypothetical protein
MGVIMAVITAIIITDITTIEEVMAGMDWGWD